MGVFDHVPFVDCSFVGGVEVLGLPECGFDLRLGLSPILGEGGTIDDAVHPAFGIELPLLWHVAQQHGFRHQHLVVVPAVVARILFLLGHDTDYFVRVIVQVNRLAQGNRLLLKKLLAYRCAQDSHAPFLADIGVAHRAAFFDRQVTKTQIFGSHAQGQKAPRIGRAAHGHLVCFGLRRYYRDRRALLADGQDVLAGEEHSAAGALAARLQLRGPTPEKHEIIADLGHILALPVAETVGEGRHHDERGDAPGDAEEREETA